MKQGIQFETRFRKIFLMSLNVALAAVVVVYNGCRLVDGTDPGINSLILNSMSISAPCEADAVVAESYSCKPSVTLPEELKDLDASIDQVIWELTPDHTCSWIEINPTTGQIFGVPSRDAIGTCVLALRVVTSEKPSSDFVQPLTIHGPKISFADKNCPLTAIAEKPYSCDIEAISPLTDAQFTYTLGTDNKCSWASVNPSTGEVSGTPSLASVGPCQLSVVTNIDSIATAVARMTITVPSVPVTVLASCPLKAEAGVSYSCAPTASAPLTSPTFTWILSAGNTCTWASINSTTGAISGVPLIQSTGPCRLDFAAKLANGSFGQSSVTVVIAPKAYNEMQLTDLSPLAGDTAGQAVAIDGNTAVVGSPKANSGRGSASIFQFDGANWRKVATLFPPSTGRFQSFGHSVAIFGTSILVGAPDSTVDDIGDGAVFAFEGAGTVWSQTQILTMAAMPDGFQMFFGSSIDIDETGSRAVAGASHYYATPGAFMLTKSGGTWSIGTPLNYTTQSRGGSSTRIKVALHGSLAVVSDTGASEVHIFRYANSAWTNEAMLSGSGLPGFGASIDVSLDKILIGVPQERNSMGGAYLYERGASSWTQTKAIRAIDEVAGQLCGTSVSLSNNQMVIGCPTSTKMGSAYVYTLLNSTWNLTSKLVPTNSQTADRFGISVGIMGRHVLIGADQFDSTSGSNSGAAYIYRTKN
ncbi:MAG: putative Ig domain-containing protein [Pseudobdellovibrionaceae bacterium]